MSRNLQQVLQRSDNGQQTYEKVANFTSHQGFANETHEGHCSQGRVGGCGAGERGEPDIVQRGEGVGQPDPGVLVGIGSGSARSH